jgi:hypothetical protein
MKLHVWDGKISKLTSKKMSFGCKHVLLPLVKNSLGGPAYIILRLLAKICKGRGAGCKVHTSLSKVGRNITMAWKPTIFNKSRGKRTCLQPNDIFLLVSFEILPSHTCNFIVNIYTGSSAFAYFC